MSENGLPQVDLSNFPSIRSAPSVRVYAEELIVDGEVELQEDVEIKAKFVHLGDGVRIERGTKIRGYNRECSKVEIGDECFIGFSNQILVLKFRMGDYSQLHNSGLTSGPKEISIGHNCWIGQGSILNCTETLSIGNNVRIGTGSQLWTHVASGEQMEGCTLLGFHPLTLEDNVWLVGGAVISPGLLLKRNSIIMTGSVLTKSTEAYHTYAGVPAKDITDKLTCWKEVSLDWKWDYLKATVAEYSKQSSVPEASFVFLEEKGQLEDLPDASEQLIFLKSADLDSSLMLQGPKTFFELSSKRYVKKRTKLEKSFLRFCVGYRARFTPFEPSL